MVSIKINRKNIKRAYRLQIIAAHAVLRLQITKFCKGSEMMFVKWLAKVMS